MNDPTSGAWITVGFTYHGLEALGVPEESLASFSAEFQQGMAARAAELEDVGESDPETGKLHWEPPMSTSRWLRCTGQSSSGRGPARADRAVTELPGVEIIWRQDCYQLPTGRTSLGFKDGIGQPAMEGAHLPHQHARAPDQAW